MPAEHDVLLSYNSRDRETVEKIGAWLKDQGLTVWFDQWELRPGLPWQEGLEGGVLSSRSVAVLVGAEGLGAWQRPEMRAFIDRATRETVPVVPTLLPGCQGFEVLELFLKAFSGVDLRQGLNESGLKRLLWGITGRKPDDLGSTSTSSPARHSFLHNLPYPSLGPLFQGRAEWLEILHRSLSGSASNKATAIAGKAVHGLGGVGKTRLAVEYAWRHAEEYRAAFFVGAQSPADLRRNLAALAGPELLNLPEQSAPEEEIWEVAVLRWLRENSGWLLILDNVDTNGAAEAVDALLPKLVGGGVLLTGRVTRWGAEVEDLPLGVLGKEDAVAFLLARTQGKRRSEGDPEKDEAQAREIARELGYLPLALEQAGAFIAARRLTFAGYLGEWQVRREQVLEWFDSRVSHYPACVAVTWQTSVDQLTEPARRLLQRLAWLGPEPIPESFLEVPIPGGEPGAEEARPTDLLAELEIYSLVTLSAEAPTFTVHRLVQDVTRRSSETEASSGALVGALAWVNAAFMGDWQDVRTQSTLESLAPHARRVVTYADKAEIAEPTARLLKKLARFYYAKALLGEAEPLMLRALDIDERSFGAEHPNFAMCLNDLAQLLTAPNRLAEAERFMRRAVDINEKRLGREHSNVAVCLNNLALLLQRTDRLAEAEPLMRRVVAIFEKTRGERHTDVGVALNNLANLLKSINRPVEAEPLMRRALDITENSLGPQHPSVALRLYNFGPNSPSYGPPGRRRHPDVAGLNNSVGLHSLNRPRTPQLGGRPQ